MTHTPPRPVVMPSGAVSKEPVEGKSSSDTRGLQGVGGPSLPALSAGRGRQKSAATRVSGLAAFVHRLQNVPAVRHVRRSGGRRSHSGEGHRSAELWERALPGLQAWRRVDILTDWGLAHVCN